MWNRVGIKGRTHSFSIFLSADLSQPGKAVDQSLVGLFLRKKNPDERLKVGAIFKHAGSLWRRRHVSTGAIDLQMKPQTARFEAACGAAAAMQAIQWTPIEPIGPVGAGLHTCAYDRLQRERHSQRER